MAIDEQTRHRLYLKLEEVLGEEAARALMEHLPPVGWGDVATKRDLDQLEVLTMRELEHLAASVDVKIESAKNELKATFREELARQGRTMVLAYAGSVASIMGLAIAARLF